MVWLKRSAQFEEEGLEPKMGKKNKKSIGRNLKEFPILNGRKPNPNNQGIWSSLANLPI